jgi:hypothetical protein
MTKIKAIEVNDVIQVINKRNHYFGKFFTILGISPNGKKSHIYRCYENLNVDIVKFFSADDVVYIGESALTLKNQRQGE